jgi:hypothetical protein
MQSAQRMGRFSRTLVLVLALAAMLGIATASTSASHFHANAASGRCDLCVTAHLPAYQAPPAQLLHGPELNGRTILLLPFFSYEPVSGQPDCARGPPQPVFVAA